MARRNTAATPQPDDRDRIAAALAGLLSPRSVEDIFAERVRVTLGKREYVLPVLPMGPEAEWRASIDVGFYDILANLGPDVSTDVGVSALATHSDKLLDALIAYDVAGVLPSRERILAEASQIEVIIAALGVHQSANPLVVIGMAVMMLGLREIGSLEQSSSPSTNGPDTPSEDSETP